MQIRYSKTENWNCETAGTKKSKVKSMHNERLKPLLLSNKTP